MRRRTLTKAALWLDRIEKETWDLSGAGLLEAPWGKMRAGDAIFLLRDHDILHVGWKLIDHLDRALPVSTGVDPQA